MEEEKTWSQHTGLHILDLMIDEVSGLSYLRVSKDDQSSEYRNLEMPMDSS
jgi:hypothetical protein